MSAITFSTRLKLRTLNRRWLNGSMLKHRAFDGQFISQTQAGTHWLKFMLSNVLSHAYNLPPPTYNQDDSLIGSPRKPARHEGVPVIVHSHSLPHGLMLWHWSYRLLGFSRYLLLVRDLRESLVSNYARFNDSRYKRPFADYLRDEVSGHGQGLLDRLRFLNEWGLFHERFPEQSHVVRYEDLRANTLCELRKVCAFFSLRHYNDDILQQAIAASTKDAMAQKPNPKAPPGAVRLDEGRPAIDWFSPQDRAYLSETCARNLRFPFGYDYQTWPPA
jgi:hypothetical protein